jgi:fructokinase
MLDLNVRPVAIADADGYRARLGRLLERCHVVKASDADLEWLDPDRSDVVAARALLDGGPHVVLVTRGERGAMVVTAEGETEVVAPEVEVADTIGAGDAFGGGFLAWWRREGLGPGDLAQTERVVEGTRFACLVAARTCERPGASPPRLSEVDIRGDEAG